MAYSPESSLKHTSNVNLRDSQTASRLFVDDQFRLAPKYKFQFHVAFSLNKAALKNANLTQRHSSEIDMLVKTCDLPSFDIQTEVLNQYNRKKVVQTTHKYNPISMVFHDDNMGVINQLWQNYYQYYYADPTSAKDPGAYARTAMKNFSYIKDTYGLNNQSTTPFFNYIKVYQLARHEYVCYTLYNPIITKWNHNKVSYYESGTHENNMEISYEAVSYNTGKIGNGEPIGFAETHYDLTPSPISGGTQTSSSPTFTANVDNTGSSIFNNAVTSVNTYQNTQSPLPTGTLSGIIKNVTSNKPKQINGVQGVVFPSIKLPNPVINAKIVNLKK